MISAVVWGQLEIFFKTMSPSHYILRYHPETKTVTKGRGTKVWIAVLIQLILTYSDCFIVVYFNFQVATGKMYEGAGKSLKALSTIYGKLFTAIGSLVIVFWANLFRPGNGLYICVSTIYQLCHPNKHTDNVERGILFWISIGFASVITPILLVRSFVCLGLDPVNLLAHEYYTRGLLEKLIFVISLLREIVHFQYAAFLGWYGLAATFIHIVFIVDILHDSYQKVGLLEESQYKSKLSKLVILTKIYRIQRQWRVVQPLLDDALWGQCGQYFPF